LLLLLFRPRELTKVIANRIDQFFFSNAFLAPNRAKNISRFCSMCVCFSEARTRTVENVSEKEKCLSLFLSL